MKTAQCQTPDRQQLSSILADRQSRRLLACLQAGPLTLRDLAVALAAAECDCARSAVTAADRRTYRRCLHHTYLPRLTDAGLVAHSPDGLVRFVPAPLDQFAVQFPALSEPDHESWSAAAMVLARAYRHPLLSSLAAADDTLSLSALAERLVECEQPRLDSAPETARTLAVSLHHVDLPKLASAGLLAYDPEERTVTATSETATVL